mgnify:CR=1 FL=1
MRIFYVRTTCATIGEVIFDTAKRQDECVEVSSIDERFHIHLHDQLGDYYSEKENDYFNRRGNGGARIA